MDNLKLGNAQPPQRVQSSIPFFYRVRSDHPGAKKRRKAVRVKTEVDEEATAFNRYLSQMNLASTQQKEEGNKGHGEDEDVMYSVEVPSSEANGTLNNGVVAENNLTASGSKIQESFLERTRRKMSINRPGPASPPTRVGGKAVKDPGNLQSTLSDRTQRKLKQTRKGKRVMSDESTEDLSGTPPMSRQLFSSKVDMEMEEIDPVIRSAVGGNNKGKDEVEN